MAERKQVNRYYPPDFDPAKHKSINKYRNSHPLRERAKKLSQGILVIRFEMPYNIWCGGCGNHIGMGVRYNAEKKKVGKYYTTPIYQFRMKCHLCDNYIEMETDPKNFDYTIVSGAQRKNQKWDMAENEQVLTEDREAVKKLSRDAMYKLEHGVDDTKKLKKAAPSLAQIAEIQAAKKDDYDQNQLLRKKFRTKKKDLLAVEANDKALLAKSSLEIDLVPEAEEDKKLASLLKYSASESYEDRRLQKREEIRNRSIFAPSTASSPNDGKLSTALSPSSTSSSSSSSTSSSNPSQHSRKHLTAHRTLMEKVVGKRSAGIFGMASGSAGSNKTRGVVAKLGSTTRLAIGGVQGFVITKTKKRRRVSEEEAVPDAKKQRHGEPPDAGKTVEERKAAWATNAHVHTVVKYGGDGVNSSACSDTMKSSKPVVSQSDGDSSPLLKEENIVENTETTHDIENMNTIAHAGSPPSCEKEGSEEIMENAPTVTHVNTARDACSGGNLQGSGDSLKCNDSGSERGVAQGQAQGTEEEIDGLAETSEQDQSSLLVVRESSVCERSSLSLVSCYSSSSGSEDEEERTES